MSDDEAAAEGAGADDLRKARELRARAEELAKRGGPAWPSDASGATPEDVRRVVQELRVHQIELEIQNEELRRAQDDLTAARERYFDLYDLAPVGYLTLDDTGKVLEANLTGSKLLGEDRGALVGRPLTSFVAPGDQDSWYHARRLLRDTGAPQSLELEMRRTSGTDFYAKLDVTRVHDEEGHEVLRIVLSDVSERRRNELERRRLERLVQQAERSESLSRMTSAIVHHFNNLLGAIAGNVELTLRGLPSDSASAAALDDALQATIEASATNRLLLTYLGQAEGEQVTRDLSELCREVLPSLRAAMPPHIALEEDLPVPGPAVAAIPGQVELLLTNLVTNACEAVGEGGQKGVVRVALRSVGRDEIPTRDRFPANWVPRRDRYSCLAVTDPGNGIEPSLVEHVFEPFFSTKAFGRGLGLPVALGAARAHGGAIAIKTGPGVESTVEAYLPLSTEAVTHPGPHQQEDPAGQKPRQGTVLVVDDETLMRKMARRVLGHLGYGVLLAANGREAVTLYREHQERISWVLCDLTMEGMNGWETLAALREISPTVQVVLTSGFDEAHAMAAGGAMEPPHAFLPKPWTLQRLAAVIP